MRKTMTIVALVVFSALVLTTSGFAATKNTGKSVQKVTVVTESSPSTTNSTAFLDIPGASASISVPAGKTQLVQVRFSAESSCFGSTGWWCSVRILANGVEMLPAAGTNYAFDSSSATDDYYEGNAMERTLLLGAGNYTILAQWAVLDAAVSFRLDDWTLTVTQFSNGQ